MKPNFALSLSFEGIRLLHRAAGGWRVVGDVGLDAPDLAGELAMLRRTAIALDPSGLRTKLLLPSGQIKYLTLETDGQDRDARMDAARRALDGATPYAVDDLAFDISQDGAQTHVAAVARETLIEAEGFAAEHQFNPVCFAAIPDDTPYLGEPFFGPTLAAKSLLGTDEEVEADGIAVVVIGDAPSNDGPVVDVPDGTPEVVAKPEAATADEDATPDAEAPSEEEATETAQTPAESLESPPEPTPSDSAEQDAPAEGVPAKGEAIETAEPVMPVFKTRATPQEPQADPEAAQDISSEEDTAAVPIAQQDAAADVPSASEAPSDPPAQSAAASTQDAETPDDAPNADADAAKSDPEPVEKAAVLPALGPARSPDAPSKAPPVAAPEPAASGFASRRGNGAPAAVRREPQVSAPDLPKDPAIAADTAGAGADKAAATAPNIAPAAEPAFAARAAAPIAAASAAAAATGRFLSRRTKKAAVALSAPIPATSAPSMQTPRTEAERMTVFGARSKDVGGKPRFLGLILVAALLVFLAGVAAWASVFMDDGLNLSRLFGDRAARPTASAPAQAPQVTSDAPVVTASLSTGLTEEDSAVLEALRDPVQPSPTGLTSQQVQAIYATSGIWAKAPDGPPEPAGVVNIDDLYLTSIDPVSTANDAVALPAVASFGTDFPLGSRVAPAAAGTQFALDARGLVVPTAAGALAPGGYTVFLGRPEAVPPATLARAQITPQDNALRQQLAGIRPKFRPKNLAEQTERAQLGGLSRPELAAFRPKLRAKSAQEAALAAAKAKAAEEKAAEAAKAEQAEAAEVVETKPAQSNAFDNPTRLAAKSSARPDTRPRNFQRIVARAQRAPKPAPETRVASTKQVAPRVVTPKNPSKSSVARQATVKNAINLRKVNLIGVYGKPSNRRALVRLSNGRYKKVTVGDRIDGGRVRAIGNSELRYTKSGRNVVLKMP